MTTETVLTAYELRYHQRKNLNTMGATDVQIASFIKAGRAIERAVLNSPEIQALRKDAERYRRLRRGDIEDVAVVQGLDAMDYGSSAVVSTYSEELVTEELDEVIDAVMENKS